MGKKINRIKLDPVPDINTHDFTIYALNEIYENEYRLQKQVRRVKRSGDIRFILLSGAMYWLYKKLKKQIEEPEEEASTE